VIGRAVSVVVFALAILLLIEPATVPNPCATPAH